jgi:hypothetical protein
MKLPAYFKPAVAAISTLYLTVFSATITLAQSVQSVPKTATPFPELGQLIANVVAIVIFLAALLVFIFLLIGGLQWITSGGDKAAAQAARDRITSALVGLVIVVAAFALMLIIERVFGVSVLGGFNPPTAPNTVGRPG